MEEFYPTSEEEVEAVVKWALATKAPLEILGHGTKRGIGHEVEAGARLHMDRLSGILSYEPDELVISAWAGTPIADIKAALEARGQHLAFEPPCYAFTGDAAGGTIGGAIAAGFAGPRRLVAGGVRDHVLGISGVTGRGEAFKIGGRVVKNVTGYDLSKLLTGSFGTLAVLTRVTLKVLPRPETTRTLRAGGLSQRASLELLRKSVASPFSVTGAALMQAGGPGLSGALIRLEGREDEIGARMTVLGQHLDVAGDVIDSETSTALWKNLSNLESLSSCDTLWRINLPRAKATDVAADLETITGAAMLFDWAGARLWLALPDKDAGNPVQFRESVSRAGGKAMLFKAPETVRSKIPVFHPEPPALATLSARVRDAFDPERILNPGRMAEG